MAPVKQKEYTVSVVVEIPNIEASTPELAIQWAESEIRDHFAGFGADDVRFFQPKSAIEEN